MITDRLIPKLKARFPDQPWKMGGANGRLASLSAPHPEVGDLELYDDGGEVIVVIGKFTHEHFGSLEDAMVFLEKLFADRIEFFGTGSRGGYRPRKERARGVVSKFLFGSKTYVWSGPLDR